MWLFCLNIVLYLAIVDNVCGQGRMLSPPGRSSLWRVGFDTPVNNNDNALNCGGNKRRFETNGGKCGICGDAWDATSRENEAGGKYAVGVIAGDYTPGSLLEVIIDISTESGGYFEFRLCANNNFSRAVTQTCLDKGVLYLKDGKTSKYEHIKSGLNEVILKLPADVECDQCVLQWKYRTADQYGCDTDQGTNKCGFGHGPIQTEYYACSDIAIHKTVMDNHLNHANVIKEHGTAHDNVTMHKLIRTKRQARWNQPSFELNQVMQYLPGKDSEMARRNPQINPVFDNTRFENTRFDNPRFDQTRFDNTRFEPLQHRQFTTPPSTVWGWNREQMNNNQNSLSRIRRRTPQIRPVQENIQMANPHINGVFSATLISGGQVRTGFNRRHTGPMPTLVIPTDPSMVRTRTQTFGRDLNRRRTSFSSSNPTSSRQITIKKVSRPRQRVIQHFSDTSRVHRKFLDPMSANLGHSEVTVHTVTQKMLRGASKSSPTRQCEHCPFDQCLDDKLKMDNLFPGLFDSPTNFFECKRYERVFTLGNYDVIKEGLPSCSHPRFKRQLQMFDDDDVGCCSTRPQVILPLTVEADNDTFSVVQLNDQKKQFIVQGVCKKSNTTSCRVCKSENNFQWVLVYDPRVNTNPPVSFVPVKFPHYCRCYNYATFNSG